MNGLITKRSHHWTVSALDGLENEMVWKVTRLEIELSYKWTVFFNSIKNDLFSKLSNPSKQIHR